MAVAVRRLYRQPSYSASIIGTLVIGIAVNASIYAVLVALVLRPLPYAHADRLVQVHTTKASVPGQLSEMSGADYRDVSQDSTVLEHAAIRQDWRASITLADGTVRQVRGWRASHEVFSIFNVVPLAGRLLNESDDRPGAPPAVVLGHAVWRDLYGGDRTVVGKVISMGDRQYEIVGVASPDLALLSDVEVFSSYFQSLTNDLEATRETRDGVVYALRHERISLPALNAALAARSLTLPKGRDGEDVRFEATPLVRPIAADVRAGLFGIQFVSVLVMIIASVNAMNIVLARAVSRTREHAIEVALGGGRYVAVHYFYETVVVGLLVTLLGVALGMALIHVLRSVAPAEWPEMQHVRLNGNVIALSASFAALAVALAYGLAWRMLRRTSPMAAIRHVGHSNLSGPWGSLGRAMLLTSQLALSFVLCVTTAAVARHSTYLFAATERVDVDNVVTARVCLNGDVLSEAEERAEFWRTLSERLTAHGEISSIATASRLPFKRTHATAQIMPSEFTQPMDARFYIISAQLVPLVGMPITSGRGIEISDVTGRPLVALVNEAMASVLRQSGPVIGRAIQGGWRGSLDTTTVVGVIDDAGVYDEPRSNAVPALYLSQYQFPVDVCSAVLIAARAPGHGSGLSVLSGTVVTQRGFQSLGEVRSLSRLRQDYLGEPIFRSIVMATFAVLGLLLAGLGTYAVVARTASDEMRNTAVRLALGATAGQARNPLWRRLSWACVLGLCIGAVLSVGVAKVAPHVLYGSTEDYVSILALIAVLLTCMVLAIVVRVSRRSPSLALAELLR